MEENLTKVARIEREIASKYGEETIKVPLSQWDEEKEKEYQKQLKEFKKKYKKKEKNTHIVINGCLYSERLLNRESIERTCIICKKLSFSSEDDFYMNKYKCCKKCYINGERNV
ncbi:hypothetical protein M0R19_04300 [Candidatus Pacearchaeota archaeon]|jgi:hypothetical protein|nr:hypothetical protein [Candidatus Pacearchaeota archaeon]